MRSEYPSPLRSLPEMSETFNTLQEGPESPAEEPSQRRASFPWNAATSSNPSPLTAPTDLTRVAWFIQDTLTGPMAEPRKRWPRPLPLTDGSSASAITMKSAYESEFTSPTALAEVPRRQLRMFGCQVQSGVVSSAPTPP